MANEITLNLKMSVVKTYLDHEENPGTLSVNMSGSNAAGGSQSITTTAAAIGVGSVTTAGYSYFRNLGPTNYLEIGTGTGTNFVAFMKLKAGEAAIARLGTNAPTAKANTATIDLQYYILSD